MNDQILKAVLLMCMGMTIVFCFLIVLVFLLQWLAHVLPSLSWMLPDPEPAKPRAHAEPANRKQEVALAIAAALQKFWGLR